jgi:hypothetical protein
MVRIVIVTIDERPWEWPCILVDFSPCTRAGRVIKTTVRMDQEWPGAVTQVVYAP